MGIEVFVETVANRRALSTRTPIQGVGINDAWYYTKVKGSDGRHTYCPYYKMWKGMIERCYSNFQKSYEDCTVCEEWLNSFSAFRDWVEGQEWEGKQLDKDIIKYGNKEYSPETCCFLSREVNSLICTHKVERDLPTGVCKSGHNYRAYCGIDGGREFLGTYITPLEALRQYTYVRSAYLNATRVEERDKRVREGLRVLDENLWKCLWEYENG